MTATLPPLGDFFECKAQSAKRKARLPSPELRITHYALRIAHYLTPSGGLKHSCSGYSTGFSYAIYLTPSGELLANAGWGLLPPKNHNYAKKTVALNCATVFCFLLTLYSTVSELLSGRQPLKPLRATPVLHFALIQRVRATSVLNSPQANFTFGFAENITLQRNISHGIAVYHKKVSRS